MRGPLRRRSAFILALGCGCVCTAAAQRPIRSQVRAVPVYAAVTGSNGGLVTGLTARDFEIRDNGRAQPITAFGNHPQPIVVAILLNNSPSLFGVSPSGPMTVAAADLPTRLDRFERGDWSVVQGPALSPDGLQSLLKALKLAAPGWIAAAGPDQQRRRRLVVATYVLEILNAEEDPYLWLGGGSYMRYHQPLPAAELVEWAADFLKRDPPQMAERWWHLGAIALLERSKAVEELVLEADRARGRFPTEDRWVLARAIADELHSWPQVRDGRMFAASGGSTLFGYHDAAARASVKDEAELRIGHFELRRGHADAALTHFEGAGNPSDSTLRYWLGLFQGQALEQLNRETDAVAAYRRAFDAAPYAQSAALALAAALEEVHRSPEAAALTERTLKMQPVPFDPWAIYTLPDIRFWPRATTELRTAITVSQ